MFAKMQLLEIKGSFMEYVTLELSRICLLRTNFICTIFECISASVVKAVSYLAKLFNLEFTVTSRWCQRATGPEWSKLRSINATIQKPWNFFLILQ